MQTIKYLAPKSSEVYLVWQSDSLDQNQIIEANEITTITDGLNYTRMELLNDTFRVSLSFPHAYSFRYYFWITKNSDGHYQNYWDLSNTTNTIASNNDLIKNAVYTHSKKKKAIGLAQSAWVLMIFALLLVLFQFKSTRKKKKVHEQTYTNKIILTSLLLILFHAMARSDILGYGAFHFFMNPIQAANVLTALIPDVIFVTFYSFLFLILGFIFTNKRRLTVLFYLLSSLILISAYINIQTVENLGKPFTYQWLYYSDFLVSDDAKTAMLSKVSLIYLVNMLSYVASFILFNFVFQRTLEQVPLKRKKMNYTRAAIIVACSLLFVGLNQRDKYWKPGLQENAILSFTQSFIQSKKQTSFFHQSNTPPPITFEQNIKSIEKPELYINPENKLKNVLIIVLESAGASYFDAYGGSFNITPNLNKYANSALLFNNFYAHAPATNRTLVSLLGSMHPYLSYKSLTQESPTHIHPTLSSELKNKGYRTSFFTSADLSFQNSSEFLKARAFDLVEDYNDINCEDHFAVNDSNYKEGNAIDDMCLANHLDNWILAGMNKNFFSVIWTVQAHYPYYFNGIEKNFNVSNINFNRYLNVIEYNDKMIGQILSNLEIAQLDSSTLVVVLGDHGEAFGQHKQFGHASYLYEENLKVPLYFINPTKFKGKRKTDIASMKDIAPTILELLNIKAPQEWQGRDLINTQANESFHFAPWSDFLFAYRKDSMKFIFNETHKTVEVYNVKNDPQELLDLSINISPLELEMARKRTGQWVQFHNKYVEQILQTRTDKQHELP